MKNAYEVIVFQLLLLIVLAAPASRADVVLLDDFDDAVLDPAWEIRLQDADGWTYAETGSDLAVSDIDPTVINSGSGGTWARVALGQDCPALYDFHVDFDFSWDCQGENVAMQYVRVALLDGAGLPLAFSGFSDAWFADCGCRLAMIGTQFQCQVGQLPFDGTASVDIDRVGEELTIVWDGTPLLSSTVSPPVERIEIQFGFYAFERQQGDSIFGSEAVDFVRVDGSTVAVDPTSWGRTKARYR